MQNTGLQRFLLLSVIYNINSEDAGNQARAHVNLTVQDINCATVFNYKELYNVHSVCSIFLAWPILAEVCFSFGGHMRDKIHDLIPQMAHMPRLRDNANGLIYHVVDTLHVSDKTNFLIPHMAENPPYEGNGTLPYPSHG